MSLKESSRCTIRMDVSSLKQILGIYVKEIEYTYDQSLKISIISHFLICSTKLSKLGEGGFGSVYLLRHKLNKREIAAKFVDVSEYLNKADNIQFALKEARYLINLDHKNIINLESVFLIK